MKMIHLLDADNYLVRSDFIEDDGPIPKGWTDSYLPDGLYKARLADGKFVSGITREAYETINKEPGPLTSDQYELEQLRKRTEEAENAILFLMDMQMF